MAAGGARIAISGASGLVGRRLGALLEGEGHTVLRLVRREPARSGEVLWDPANGRLDPAALEGIDAFVHLSGESIASGRWSPARKREIVESRTVTTRLVAAALARLASKPVLVSASAIGYYGDRGGEWLDETSPPGRGFLPEVCVEWERACDAARAAGLRVVNPRIGVVLDPSGGALAAMLLPFRLGLGGKLGSGSQYVAWITLDDLVGAIRHCIVSEHALRARERRGAGSGHERGAHVRDRSGAWPSRISARARHGAPPRAWRGRRRASARRRARLVPEARSERLRVPRSRRRSGARPAARLSSRARQCTPTPGTSELGSMPSECSACSHIFSAGVSKISAGVTSAVSHAPCASSLSSCCAPHPA